MVIPVYYVLFTTSVIMVTAVLFQGSKTTLKKLATLAIGFELVMISVVMIQVNCLEKDQ